MEATVETAVRAPRGIEATDTDIPSIGDQAPGLAAAIIPAFNEAPTIGTMVLLARQHVDQVVVVDDGSADDTADVARAAGAVVIRHERNAGKGRALRTGFEWARENDVARLVVLDGDGQHDPKEIPKLLEPLETGDADITIGIRFGDNTEMPRWRRAGKRVLDYATAAGSGGGLTDSQSGFRGFNRRSIETLRPEQAGFAVESEILMLAKRHDLWVQELPVRCAYDDLDTSTMGAIPHAATVLAGIVRIIGEKHPLLMLGVPAVGMLIGGVFLAVHVFNVARDANEVAVGSAVLASLLILASLTIGLAAVILHVLPGAIAKQVRAQLETYPGIESDR